MRSLAIPGIILLAWSCSSSALYEERKREMDAFAQTYIEAIEQHALISERVTRWDSVVSEFLQHGNPDSISIKQQKTIEAIATYQSRITQHHQTISEVYQENETVTLERAAIDQLKQGTRQLQESTRAMQEAAGHGERILQNLKQ